jgi:hypothetical protein
MITHPRGGFLPLQIEDPTAWVGHLPFAYWFVGVVRPRVFFRIGDAFWKFLFHLLPGSSRARLADPLPRG